MACVAKCACVTLLLAALSGSAQGATVYGDPFQVGPLGGQNIEVRCDYYTSWNPLSLSWHNYSETIIRWILSNPSPVASPKYAGQFNMTWGGYYYGWTELVMYQVNASMPGLTCILEDSQPSIQAASIEFCAITKGNLSIRLSYTDAAGANHTIEPNEILDRDPSTIRNLTVTCDAANFKPQLTGLRVNVTIDAANFEPESVTVKGINATNATSCTVSPPADLENVYDFQKFWPVYSSYGRVNFIVQCTAITEEYDAGSDDIYFSFQAFCNCTQMNDRIAILESRLQRLEMRLKDHIE